jgi:ribosome biogenesis GTPase
MEPVAVWARPGGDWAVIHRCRGCGTLKSNRIAGDDSELLLIALAARALSAPPFPMSRVVAGVADAEPEA